MHSRGPLVDVVLRPCYRFPEWHFCATLTIDRSYMVLVSCALLFLAMVSFPFFPYGFPIVLSLFVSF